MAAAVNISRYLSIIFSVLFVLAGIFIGAVEYVGRAIGSTMLPRQMAQAQAAYPETLVVPGELKYWMAYKLPRIEAEAPEVILVGSSRGGEFRSAMFKPYKFYNASFTAWNLRQITDLVDRITLVSKPRVIIVGLDYFMFTNRYADSMENRSMFFDRDLRYRYDSLNNIVKVLVERPSLFREKVYPRMIGQDSLRVDGLKPLGIFAMQNEFGFRWDGSYLYSSGQLSMASQQTKNNEGLLNATPGGPRIDARQMAQLEKLVALARERGVQLVGIQLPYLKASVDFLNDKESYRYLSGVWREFKSSEMTKKFRDLGIPFFDLCCGPISADDRNFIDAVHIDERATLEMWIHLLEDTEINALFPAIDVGGLKRDLSAAEAKGEYFHVYHNQF